jgi:uncharacterized protein (DUF433 family)
VPYHIEGLGSELGAAAGAPVPRASAAAAALWSERLTFDSSVSAHSPTVKGTRITARRIVSLVVDGHTWTDILGSHPEICEDDIRACLAYTVEQEDGPDLA